MGRSNFQYNDEDNEEMWKKMRLNVESINVAMRENKMKVSI
jgi:hypothetical protein